MTAALVEGERAQACESLAPARPDPLFHVVILALSLSVLILAFALSVRGGTQVVMPVISVPLPEVCMSRRLLGLDCPGCGLTRSFIALAHGNLAAAWSFNPAGPLLFALVGWQVPYRVVQLWRIRSGRREIQVGYLTQVALGVLVAVMIGQWALRMIGIGL